MAGERADYPRMTPAEYLAFDRASEIKHELINGYVYAMTGASQNHNLIVSSIIATLYRKLRTGGCRVYPSDMRVQIDADTYTYPDITVVCGESRLADRERETLLNPTLIIEVLSPSTERYDRGRKFQFYRQIDSLRTYVLIAQDSPRIEWYVRGDDGRWQFNDAAGLDAQVDLTAIGCTLALAEVYEQVTFPEQPDDGRGTVIPVHRDEDPA